METEKTSREDSAVEISPQFALHEASDRRALLVRIGKEGLEILSHDLVEQGLFGLVALVLDGAGSRRDRGLVRAYTTSVPLHQRVELRCALRPSCRDLHREVPPEVSWRRPTRCNRARSGPSAARETAWAVAGFGVPEALATGVRLLGGGAGRLCSRRRPPRVQPPEPRVSRTRLPREGAVHLGRRLPE